jgi:hypothetical protein
MGSLRHMTFQAPHPAGDAGAAYGVRKPSGCWTRCRTCAGGSRRPPFTGAGISARADPGPPSISMDAETNDGQYPFASHLLFAFHPPPPPQLPFGDTPWTRSLIERNRAKPAAAPCSPGIAVGAGALTLSGAPAAAATPGPRTFHPATRHRRDRSLPGRHRPHRHHAAAPAPGADPLAREGDGRRLVARRAAGHHAGLHRLLA